MGSPPFGVLFALDGQRVVARTYACVAMHSWVFAHSRICSLGLGRKARHKHYTFDCVCRVSLLPSLNSSTGEIQRGVNTMMWVYWVRRRYNKR